MDRLTSSTFRGHNIDMGTNEPARFNQLGAETLPPALSVISHSSEHAVTRADRAPLTTMRPPDIYEAFYSSLPE